jgi:hypothetical protein
MYSGKDTVSSKIPGLIVVLYLEMPYGTIACVLFPKLKHFVG